MSSQGSVQLHVTHLARTGWYMHQDQVEPDRLRELRDVSLYAGRAVLVIRPARDRRAVPVGRIGRGKRAGTGARPYIPVLSALALAVRDVRDLVLTCYGWLAGRMAS